MTNDIQPATDAEIKAIRSRWKPVSNPEQHEADIYRLLARVEAAEERVIALEADAERYRWIATMTEEKLAALDRHTDWSGMPPSMDAVTLCVDAARKDVP